MGDPGGGFNRKNIKAPNGPALINNPDWAKSFFTGDQIDAMRMKLAEDKGRPGSSHSQHRMKLLRENHLAAKHDAAEMRKHRKILIDEYTKAHYQVAEGERVLRLKPKARAGPPSGQMMKALVENTFSAGVHEPIVDNQMMSTIRQQHITAYGTGEGQEGPYEMLPRRKLTLMSSPLSAPDIPFNRRQEKLMTTMKTMKVTVPRGVDLPGYDSMPASRQSTQSREAQKFTSLSGFLTGQMGSKYMRDPGFASALSKVVNRAKKIDTERSQEITNM